MWDPLESSLCAKVDELPVQSQEKLQINLCALLANCQNERQSHSPNVAKGREVLVASKWNRPAASQFALEEKQGEMHHKSKQTRE